MNRRDFLRWWGDYCEHFPAAADWVDGLGEDRAMPLLRHWQETLEDVDVDAAMAITRAMAVGDLEPIPRWPEDQQQTAARIRRAVLEQDRLRRSAKTPTGPPPPIRGHRQLRPGAGIKAAMSEVARLVRSGVDRYDATSQVLGQSEHKGPVYDCWLCRDTGIVLVWSVASMRACRYDPGLLEHAVYRRTMVAPCECSRGDWHIAEGDTIPPRWAGWTSQAARYSPDRWCHVTDPDRPSEIEQFKDWCELYFQRQEQ